MEPLISVIIPIYNMEHYLARCLDSVISNSYSQLELLCVDDGSTDSSLELLHRYAEKDSRIHIIAKENGGVASARNIGIERSQGEYLAFIDPDDFIHPQYFELLMAALRASDSDYAICDVRQVFDVDLPLKMEHLTLFPENLKELVVYNAFTYGIYFSCCYARLIRKELVSSLRFNEAFRIGEDTLFSLSLWEQNPSMHACFIPYALYYYYQREDSAVRQGLLEGKIKINRHFAYLSGTSPLASRIYLDRALFGFLKLRYYCKSFQKNRKIARECQRQLRRLCRPVLFSPNYTKKEKILTLLFIFSAKAYRRYRVKKDPKLLEMERGNRNPSMDFTLI